MVGIIYLIWRKLLWRHPGSTRPGSKASKEWQQKMARLKEEKQVRRQEIEQLKHDADKAVLELKLAKAEAEIDDYLGVEPQPIYQERDPTADFVSAGLRALFSGRRGEENVATVPGRGAAASIEDRRRDNGEQSAPGSHRKGTTETAQALLDEVENE